MAHFLPHTLVFALALSACMSSATQKPDSGRSPGQKTNNGDAATTPNPDGTQEPTRPPGGPAARSALDIVLVSAIGDENPSESQRQARFFQDLVAALGRDLASKDIRLAVIASQTAALSGVTFAPEGLAAFPAGSTRHVNFELAPRDALLGSLVVGCNAEDSDLDSTHSAGAVTVCGQSVKVPPHSWTWGSEDLKGRLAGFLRSDATRIYVVVASSNATIVTAQEFLAITSAQNGGQKPRVAAIAPSTREGFCTERNTAATALDDLARQSSGQSFSYCRADWTPFIAEILKLL